MCTLFINTFHFIFKALYASKIVSYAQGFMLLKQAAKDYSWKLNYGSIALMWRGGCIIRRYEKCYTQIKCLHCMFVCIVCVCVCVCVCTVWFGVYIYSCFSRFLGNIKEAFEKKPDLTNLLLDDFFRGEILKCQVCVCVCVCVCPCCQCSFMFVCPSQDSWRKVVAAAVGLGIPTPCFSCALAFFDGYRLAAGY